MCQVNLCQKQTDIGENSLWSSAEKVPVKKKFKPNRGGYHQVYSTKLISQLYQVNVPQFPGSLFFKGMVLLTKGNVLVMKTGIDVANGGRTQRVALDGTFSERYGLDQGEPQ